MAEHDRPRYHPLLELDLRRKAEGGALRRPGEFRGALDARARRECLVLIHGFNNSRGEAAQAYLRFRTAATHHFEPADAYSFDRYFGDTFWPGDADYWSVFDYADFLVYPSAVNTAVQAAREVADLLWQLPNLQRVDFIAHSLGCRVTLETLLLLRERVVPMVGRVCLMAAAVPAEMLEPGGRFYDMLTVLAVEGTQFRVLHSTHDTVLHYAFGPGQALAGRGEASTRALGRRGPSPLMPGFGATLTQFQVPRAGHGDYWGDLSKVSSKAATKDAGTFLKLGDIR